MKQLLVFEFPSTGPFGPEAEAAYADLADDIAGQEGLVWKVWTEDPQREVAGGVYLFADEASARAYVEKHTARLAGFGITDITATAYEVNEGLSRVDHALLER
ncbi:monooxygenase [Corynebacterium comes]|uniref:Monooxygenase YdhR n=1 Tax=Corynebacterium comes TaxID=2675218 RepID=A0A6B8VDX0_9CORY|nr:monooxygenase [Corynebacterium comes]QGU03432.1 Putative monooxygenase YdhR [Corynebacterium comes]